MTEVSFVFCKSRVWGVGALRIHSSLYWIIMRTLLGMNRTIIPLPDLSPIVKNRVFITKFSGSRWLQSRVYNTAAVYAGSWMVDLLELRANGQLGRDWCLRLTIIHWPQISPQPFASIHFIPSCVRSVFGGELWWSTHQFNASSASENREWELVKSELYLSRLTRMRCVMFAVTTRKFLQAQQTWYGDLRHIGWFQMIVNPLIWANKRELSWSLIHGNLECCQRLWW